MVNCLNSSAENQKVMTVRVSMLPRKHMCLAKSSVVDQHRVTEPPAWPEMFFFKIHVQLLVSTENRINYALAHRLLPCQF